MTVNSDRTGQGGVRWRYLALAVLVFVLMMVLLAAVWQVPRFLPGGEAEGVEVSPTRTPTATVIPATVTPSVAEPTIRDLGAEADDEARTITFSLKADVPPGRDISEVLLWYDTEAGHKVRRLPAPPSSQATLSYRLDALQEGLTRTLTTTHQLGYWWLVRDSAGESVRTGGTVFLGPELRSLVTTPTPEVVPSDFQWASFETRRFHFYYMPDTAAERDLSDLAELAEASLDEISSALEVSLDGQMSVYLVPRIFWQGGAAYQDKIQLISYLDRNYTSVETWSYFTHEGTHALAQDLLQPKENGGGPDGVLVEGLAVWASDGHYRREPIDAWAALVAGSDSYLPLSDLRAGPFYDFQHETSYLEGASFVKFLIEHYGLDRFKQLYGQATGEAEHDEALVQQLYGEGYGDLEAEWLAYLDGLVPTTEQKESWLLKVRSFDLMRRYETELDPDARLLPSSPPPEWTSDTLKVFLGRKEGTVNVVLETALIAAHERLYKGDFEGAAALLEDVETTLDDGGTLTRPSLTARRAILTLVHAQDRAILLAAADAYRATLAQGSNLRLEQAVDSLLQTPFTAYQQEMVRLDIAEDGLSAEGTVLLHAETADGEYPGDGQRYAVSFHQIGGQWFMAGRETSAVMLSLPPATAD
jgi:hypothetical protein